jgi:mono/diheme cytochrome c family protein
MKKRSKSWFGAMLLFAFAACSKRDVGRAAAPDAAALTFRRDDGPETRLTLEEILRQVAPEQIDAFDPYYARAKRFRALPLVQVLKLAFATEPELRTREFVFRAKDGYAAYFRGDLATDAGAYIAYEDLDVPGWEPIGQARANPGPFYVIWKSAEGQNLETHPRPWQLQRIEMVHFDAAYPHTAPYLPGRPLPEGAQAMIGYTLFRQQCFRCHAINREGGRVGPELNVPQNITEYRPEAQVRAYIKNPGTFRYSNMPAHPDLTSADLDSLLAYLRAMAALKYDKT